MFLRNNGVRLLMVLSFLASAPALADGACAVPVCDLDKAVAEFRAMPQSQRFQIIKGYEASYKNSTDVAVLENLSAFGQRLTALFAEIREEDWMIREAQTLSSMCNVGLAKYSPLSVEKISGYYRLVRGSDARGPLIDAWTKRIEEYDDKASLMALLDLFEKMAVISDADGDEAYVARGARSAQAKVTSRLVKIYPYFEGTYRVTTRCTGLASSDPVPSYCKGQIDRLVIMDSLTDDEIQVSLVISRSASRLFRYKKVIISQAGTTFVSSPLPGMTSEMSVTLDKATGRLRGSIKTAESLGTLEIEGELEQSPSRVYDRQLAGPNAAPLALSELTGAYRGQFAGHPSVLTIRAFESGQVGASLTFSDVPAFPYAFQYSKFYSKLGILVLVGAQSNGALLKITAFFEKQADGSLRVHGLSYSDGTGASQELELSAAAR
jgi:hypothetical protein